MNNLETWEEELLHLAKHCWDRDWESDDKAQKIFLNYAHSLLSEQAQAIINEIPDKTECFQGGHKGGDNLEFKQQLKEKYGRH